MVTVKVIITVKHTTKVEEGGKVSLRRIAACMDSIRVRVNTSCSIRAI